MPKAARRTSGPSATSNRTAPYPKTSPKAKPENKSATDKENVDPNPPSTTATSAKGDYRAIDLEEIKGEIPCYDNATTVRRKLNKLIADKGTIPGTSKKWNKSTVAAEMQELEKRGHAVEYNRNANGPTPRSLGGFLKRSGQMGGGDSPCYYWGNAMLEKLRIYNGEKKSKPRIEAEKQYPGGYVRDDPKKRHITMPASEPTPPNARGPKPRCPT
ncbi:MAG: hypothetical protein ASARMPRED_002469 [Alectoria sarmentosa]|nr:MAG: hypothetical protein ASARMPRED_002469 [Alectoria sarmentosa]